MTTDFNTRVNGRTIEGQIYQARSDRVAIIAHPYAPLGGSQDDHVVRFLALRFQNTGITCATFNFSRPTSFTARKEKDEYRAISNHLLDLYTPQLIYYCGYSYGSLTLPPRHTTVETRYIVISPLIPPTSNLLTLSTRDAYSHMKNDLIIYGTRDQFASIARLRSRFKGVELDDDHFWHYKEELWSVILAWLSK